MLERNLVKKILKQLNALPGVKAIKQHGSQYSEAGTPDILGCYNGRMFAIEVKVGKNKPTPLQEIRLKEWQAAGAIILVAYEDADAIGIIEEEGTLNGRKETARV